MANPEFRRGLTDDGLYAPSIKQHSLAKIRLHNAYIDVFTTAIRKRWDQLAYLGLYSGPGRARVDGTGEIVETTALSALRLRNPFTHYIFVDNDPRCIEALDARSSAIEMRDRVTLIEEDVQDASAAIIDAMPSHGHGNTLLSFCFIDPFSADLDFEVIRSLGSRYQMDFLILLMLGRDVRTNFRRYLEDPEDTRIAKLIDDPDWREEWMAREVGTSGLLRYLLEKFDKAMVRIGYRAPKPGDAHPIKIMGKNVFLYFLVFYSKHELGQKFWKAIRRSMSDQTELGL